MSDRPHSWLDALTGGQILRDWVSLFGSMWFSVRVLHFSAVNLHRLNTLFLPTPKNKRRVSRLELVEEQEARYYIDEEGEISTAKRKL